MTTMMLRTPPYGDAIAGRGLDVRRQIEEKNNSTGWAPKDISAGRYTYELRAWSEDDTSTHIIRDPIAKGPDAASGWLQDYIPCGNVVYPMLIWETVELDTGGVDTATPSGFPELVLERWRQPIIAATVAGATG